MFVYVTAGGEDTLMPYSPTDQPSLVITDVERWKLDGNVCFFSWRDDSTFRFHRERNKRRDI